MLDNEAVRLAAQAMALGASQDELELVALVRELRDRQIAADVVLELGVFECGTLALWRELWPDARIVGVDLVVTPELRHRAELLEAELVRGDTRDPEVVRYVRELVDDNVDLLHIDADHDATSFYSDWTNYLHAVRPGGLVLVHDVRWNTLTAPWADVSRANPAASTIALHEDRLGFGLYPVPRED